jgi:catechol 2,3-dioxygenase-like lactoylglutathione lyase family enzyme
MTAVAEKKMPPARAEGMVLTHGTAEGRDLPPARDFYENVLGLRCVRHSPLSQFVAGPIDFGVVCLVVGDKLTPQGSENRWVISIGDEQAVVDAHRKAVESSFPEHVGDITRDDGIARFILQDGDSNWWEVTSLPADYYSRYFDQH